METGFRSVYFLIVVLALLIGSAASMAQSSIGGSATIWLTDGGTDCSGRARLVDVHVDITGLSGLGGPAGLNSFVLAFELTRADVFASALRGTSPDLGWGLCYTNQAEIVQTNTVVLVGWAPDPDAPNGDYWVVSMLLSGTPGNVSLTFDPSASSLGSRVVNGDGPDAIDFIGPSPFLTSIPSEFDLELVTGVAYWRTDNPDYNLVPASPLVTVLDLVKLVQCGG